MTNIFKPLLAGAILIAAVASANAQQYPNRPIHVISPYPAGSASDTVTRVVMDQVSQLIGQPVVIDLKPGAGGAVGFGSVARSDPDGYTLATSSSSMATESVLHSKLPYDPVKDFVPVVLLGTSPNILVASVKSGFKTLADLVATAKAKPGTLTFASAGIGSSSHMAAERFRLAADIDVRHVPFKEGGLVQVMNGNIDFYFIPLAAAASALSSGELSRDPAWSTRVTSLAASSGTLDATKCTIAATCPGSSRRPGYSCSITDAVALCASRRNTEGFGSAKCTRALCTPCTLTIVRASSVSSTD